MASAYNPSSNGLAEAAVKSVKRLLVKTMKTGEDFGLALQAFRNAPRADKFSPCQMLLGRRQRSLLPALPSKKVHFAEAEEARRKTRESTKKYHDRTARALPPLEVGSRVRLQHPISLKWDTTGTVKEVRESGRSYIVESEGKAYTRNRKALRPDLTKPPESDKRDREIGGSEESAESKAKKTRGKKAKKTTDPPEPRRSPRLSGRT